MAVSVLLPFHNEEKNLPACLEAIQQQTYQDFEVIAVNDGSSDQGKAIVSAKSASDPRFHLINLPAKQGIVRALQVGLQYCQHDWIARIDADDIMLPTRLAKQYAYSQANPQFALLGSQIAFFQNDTEPLTQGQEYHRTWQNHLLTNEDITREIFIEAPISHPSFFMSRNMTLNVGGYLDSPWAEDYDFLFRVWKSGYKMAKLPEILVKKQVSKNQLSQIDVRCKRKAMFAAKAHYFAFTQGGQTHKPRYIVSTGNSARLLYKSLSQANIEVQGFLDRTPYDPLRTIFDKPVLELTRKIAPEQQAKLKESFLLLAIGDITGRANVLNLFDSIGLQWKQDYERFL